MTGYITYTEAATGQWICWLTETEPPRHVTVVSMFLYPGDVYFGMGATKEEAFAELEEDMREVPAKLGRRSRRLLIEAARLIFYAVLTVLMTLLVKRLFMLAGLL